MGKSRRERQYEATQEEIKAIARRHMAEEGAAAVSLRAIARDMGITAPALYRYFPSIDDLLTALLVDAFDALAEALVHTADSHPTGDPVGRLLAVLLAYREWAITHPVDYQLLYGKPIPSYTPPEEVTKPAAIRTMAVIVRAIYRAVVAGALTPPPVEALPDTVRQTLAPIASAQHEDLPLAVLYIGAAWWPHLHGLVVLELYGHSPALVGDPAAFYRHEVLKLFNALGYQEEANTDD